MLRLLRLLDAPMHRRYLLELLDRYATPFMEEARILEQIRRFVRAEPACFERHAQGGHVTGSAWVLNPARTHVFLHHHRKRDRWVQPGGHSDGDPDTLRVALRETSEESGVAPEHIRPLSEEIFDVNLHTIPARRKAPAHLHFDIRFLLEMDDTVALVRSEESLAVAWVPLAQVTRLNNHRAVFRMLEKTRRLRMPAYLRPPGRAAAG